LIYIEKYILFPNQKSQNLLRKSKIPTLKKPTGVPTLGVGVWSSLWFLFLNLVFIKNEKKPYDISKIWI